MAFIENRSYLNKIKGAKHTRANTITFIITNKTNHDYSNKHRQKHIGKREI